MTQRKLRLFLVIAVLFIAGVYWTLARENAAMDRCLDAGQRWDSDAGRCAGSG